MFKLDFLNNFALNIRPLKNMEENNIFNIITYNIFVEEIIFFKNILQFNIDYD